MVLPDWEGQRSTAVMVEVEMEPEAQGANCNNNNNNMKTWYVTRRSLRTRLHHDTT